MANLNLCIWLTWIDIVTTIPSHYNIIHNHIYNVQLFSLLLRAVMISMSPSLHSSTKIMAPSWYYRDPILPWGQCTPWMTWGQAFIRNCTWRIAFHSCVDSQYIQSKTHMLQILLISFPFPFSSLAAVYGSGPLLWYSSLHIKSVKGGKQESELIGVLSQYTIIVSTSFMSVIHLGTTWGSNEYKWVHWHMRSFQITCL